MVLPLYNVLSKIDKDVIFAARDLGATAAYTFRKIIFPLSMPGIISGITMVFVPSLTTFVISDLLGGSKILLIGNVIDRQFQQGSNWNVGSGLSLVLMVFIFISMLLTGKYDKNGKEVCSDEKTSTKYISWADSFSHVTPPLSPSLSCLLTLQNPGQNGAVLP